MFAYFCSSIDSASSGAKLWRQKLAPFLRERVGHRVYDPAEEEARILTLEEAANFAHWKTTDLDRFRRMMRRVVAANTEIIEHKADYLICYWDADGGQGGVPAEVTLAYRKGIPVYLIAAVPIEQVSSWVLGCSDQVFSSVESLKEYLAARFIREKQTHLWKK